MTFGMITLDTIEENGLEMDKGEMGDQFIVGCRSPGRRCFDLPGGRSGDLGREQTVVKTASSHKDCCLPQDLRTL